MDLECFILSRQWRDERNGLELVYWGVTERGPVRVRLTGERAVCFAERDAGPPVAAGGTGDGCERKPVNLTALDTGKAVDAVYFTFQRDLQQWRQMVRAGGGRLLESDIKPSDRFLMERFVTAACLLRGEVVEGQGFLEMTDPQVKTATYRPELKVTSLDIETEGLEGALYSIAVSSRGDEKVFIVATDEEVADSPGAVACPNEVELLGRFYGWLREADPDVLIGWNIVNFDLDFLDRRSRELGVEFAVGRGTDRSTVLQPQSANGVRVARTPGRVVLDGIELLRAGFWNFESFELQTVAQALLGRGKQIDEDEDRVGEIQRLFREDKPSLVAYNLEDCRLVRDIFDEAQLLSFALRRAELTGLNIDRLGGSVAAFDNLYLPRLHRAGKVAPDVGEGPRGPGSPGGYVLDSKPGLYENVLVLDFKSLYPSIIRTFQIDPFGLAEPGDDPVPGFNDASFAREGAILPGLIEHLWAVRDEAKQAKDAPMSQAVKILMNSFYGVLGAYGCRFFDPRLASSITRRGHQIIRDSHQRLAERGFEVIYGDTDSLFVLLGPNPDDRAAHRIGDELAADLNGWWAERLRSEYALESHLEIEFETVYRRFLMPTVRGEQTGSKKRYAGLIVTDEAKRGGRPMVVFKGLESVRTDWTPVAREFQRELYTRIFTGQPFEAFVKETLARLYDGALDDQLIYRKRIRRALDDYKVNVPPHIQAARKLSRPSRWVRYVITAGGPEPLEAGRPAPRPDYDHYRDRQLAPAADGILQFLETSFDRLTDAQLSIF